MFIFSEVTTEMKNYLLDFLGKDKTRLEMVLRIDPQPHAPPILTQK